MLDEGLVNAEHGAPLKRAEPRVYRHVILVSTSVFMGYAALVTLQHRLKNVHDEVPHPPDSTEFKHASTLNYVGNLVFRLAHNFVFCFLSPRIRVHLSLSAMALAMGFLGFAMCIAKSPWIGWVFISYFLGGVAIGTFESNLLSCITPLGHGTKKWVIFGMPLGFNLISVGGFLLMQAGVPLVALYMTVMVCCLLSMAVFALTIPAVPALGATPSAPTPHDVMPSANEAPNAPLTVPSDAAAVAAERDTSHFGRFLRDVRTAGRWFPKMGPHTIALMCDMYCVSFFSSIMLYVFNDSHPGGKVALLGPNTTSLLVPHDAYFAVYNCFTFLGDTLSRQLVYRAPRLYHPFWYLLLSAAGAAICLLKIPLVAPLGIFLGVPARIESTDAASMAAAATDRTVLLASMPAAGHGPEPGLSSPHPPRRNSSRAAA